MKKLEAELTIKYWLNEETRLALYRTAQTEQIHPMDPVKATGILNETELAQIGFFPFITDTGQLQWQLDKETQSVFCQQHSTNSKIEIPLVFDKWHGAERRFNFLTFDQAYEQLQVDLAAAKETRRQELAKQADLEREKTEIKAQLAREKAENEQKQKEQEIKKKAQRQAFINEVVEKFGDDCDKERLLAGLFPECEADRLAIDGVFGNIPADTLKAFRIQCASECYAEYCSTDIDTDGTPSKNVHRKTWELFQTLKTKIEDPTVKFEFLDFNATKTKCDVDRIIETIKVTVSIHDFDVSQIFIGFVHHI